MNNYASFAYKSIIILPISSHCWILLQVYIYNEPMLHILLIYRHNLCISISVIYIRKMIRGHPNTMYLQRERNKETEMIDVISL